MSDTAPGGELPWLVPPPYDASAASLTAHAHAIGEAMAGRGRLWLGPFAPPSRLPAGFEDTALVVPTSGSTGAAKAVALSREALLASQDATAQLFADDGTAPSTRGHGFWLPLLPPTHIAGVQVIARAHRAAQVLGLEAAALPAPLPDLRGHFDAATFATLAEPALTQAEQLGLPAITSLVPTQLARIATGTSGADVRSRALLKRFAAVLVGGAATSPDVLAGARAQKIAVRTTYGSSETAGGCVYDREPLPGVQLRVVDPDLTGAGRLEISSPTLALGYLTAEGGTDSAPFGDGPARSFGERPARSFLTSDLAQLDVAGTLTVLGRADDVINTGGRKASPQDVGTGHRAFADAARDGARERGGGGRGCRVGAARRGAGDPRARTRSRRCDRSGALGAAHQRGARHMIPKRVHVVAELPLLGIGKVDRAAARRLASR